MNNIKRIIKVSVCLLLLCVLAFCSVISATAATPQNAWLINRYVNPSIPSSNFNPTLYESIESNSGLGSGTVSFLTDLQASITALGFDISHWEGLPGSTSGVSGRMNYEWQSGVSSGKDTYWVLMSYTVMISKDSGPYQSSVYIRDPEYEMDEIDSFTGTLDLGVATVNATGTVYRVTNNPVTTGGAFASYLQVNYQSGTYMADGMQFPVIIPKWYEEQTDAEKALDDIKQGIDDLNENLMGTASHPAIDDMSNENAGVQSRADAVLDGLDVGDIVYSTPDPVVYDTNASGVLNWLFSIDFVWTFILTACGLWLTKVILYGIG